MARFSTQLAVVLGLITACTQFAMAQMQGFSPQTHSVIPRYPLGQGNGYTLGQGNGYPLGQLNGSPLGGYYGGQLSGGSVYPPSGGYGGTPAAPLQPIPAGSASPAAPAYAAAPDSSVAAGAGAAWPSMGGTEVGSDLSCHGCWLPFLHGACSLPLHYCYCPPMYGYYYFRPYHASHVGMHQAFAARFGADPRNPYSNDVFKLIYTEYRASQRDRGPQSIPAPLSPEPIPTPPSGVRLP